jgi:hypothetical protein
MELTKLTGLSCETLESTVSFPSPGSGLPHLPVGFTQPGLSKICPRIPAKVDE